MGKILNQAHCNVLNATIKILVDQFVEKYYTYSDWSRNEPDTVDREDEELSYTWNIGDEFRSINDIFTALRFDIPKKILFDWYALQLDYWLKKASWKEVEGTPLNLKNYYKAYMNIKDLWKQTFFE